MWIKVRSMEAREVYLNLAQVSRVDVLTCAAAPARLRFWLVGPTEEWRPQTVECEGEQIQGILAWLERLRYPTETKAMAA